MEEDQLKPEGKMWLLVILVALIFAGALFYFGKIEGVGDYKQGAAITGAVNRQTRTYVVYYNTGVFSPTNLRIHAGDSVKFQNDSLDKLHVVSDSTDGALDLAGFDSIGDIPPKGAFAFTFTEAGSFGYHNDSNKSERGMVIVRQ